MDDLDLNVTTDQLISEVSVKSQKGQILSLTPTMMRWY